MSEAVRLTDAPDDADDAGVPAALGMRDTDVETEPLGRRDVDGDTDVEAVGKPPEVDTDGDTDTLGMRDDDSEPDTDADEPRVRDTVTDAVVETLRPMEIDTLLDTLGDAPIVSDGVTLPEQLTQKKLRQLVRVASLQHCPAPLTKPEGQ